MDIFKNTKKSNYNNALELNEVVINIKKARLFRPGSVLYVMAFNLLQGLQKIA